MFGVRRGHRQTDGRLIPGGLFSSLRDLLFPPRCHVCGAVYENRGNVEAAAGFAAEFARLLSPFLCPACRGRFVPAGPGVPGSLMPEHRPFGVAWAAGRYEGGTPFARLIGRYKYGGRAELAGSLSRLLRSVFEAGWPADAVSDPVDVVAPVPLYPAKIRKRGFNQAWLLIRPWENDPPGGVRVVQHLLKRVRATRPQAGLSAREREKNLRGAFRLGDGVSVLGQRVVLVDDVLTTGATAGGCTEVLRSAGAANVDVLTLGRTPHPMENQIDG
ncbi:MAG: ComF family protein [Desulfococcaceae bacterium]